MYLKGINPNVIGLLAMVAGATWAAPQAERFYPPATLAPAAAAETEHTTSAAADGNSRDIAFKHSFADDFQPPVSQWKTNEQERHLKLLLRGRYDLMVIPFQVDGYAFDRATRSLATAELTYALGELKYRLPDPYLLSRALGDGARTHEFATVSALAGQFNVPQIILSHIGHDGNGVMHVTLQLMNIEWQERGKVAYPKKVARGEWRFSGDRPPIQAFHEELPKLIRTLIPDRDGQQSPGVADAAVTPIELPANPADLFSPEEDDPVRNAVHFQLLAYLTPERRERTRQRFIEKSLLSIYRSPPSDPRLPALKARAYMQLGLRPAAMAVLESPVTTEEKALVETLNGNLPALRELTPQIQSKIARLMSALDANLIGAKYQVITKRDSLNALEAAELPGPIWTFLATRAFTEWDSWFSSDNVRLKQLLDAEFPLEDYSLERIIKAAQALGDEANLRTTIQLSAAEHVSRLFAAKPEIWCCDDDLLRPKLADYVDLLTALGTDNLMRTAKLIAWVQASPGRAEHFLNSIEPVYDGHPELALYRSHTRSLQAEEKSGVERENLFREAKRAAFDAFYWSGGQSQVSEDALAFMTKLYRYPAPHRDDPYALDHPARPNYLVRTHTYGSQFYRSRVRAAVENSTYQFRAVEALSQLLDLERREESEIQSMLQGRFAGSPKFIEFMAGRSLDREKHEEVEAYYRRGIDEIPGYWDFYRALGKIQFERGEIDDAYSTFMEWPGFSDGENVGAVARGNHAYIAGSHFYWSGHLDYAKTLYGMAAAPDTGSEASMASRLRLDLLEGKYEEATALMLDRARRYRSSYAYRDYLGMLHAVGESPQAWDAFNALVERLDTPHIWETALTGHRRGAATEDDIAEWVKAYLHLTAKDNDSYAAIYLLRAGVTDRIPSEQLAGKIERTDRVVWRHRRGSYVSVRRGREIYSGQEDPYHHEMRGDKRVRVKNPNIELVRSDLAHFAESYRAIRLGQFAEAAQLLGETIRTYGWASDRFGYLLPYYAYAAAKAGDTAGVRDTIKLFNSKTPRFDLDLAEAVLAGIAGDHEKADKHLTLARYRRPHTESRVLHSEYQYAELCELLYEATGREAYRERLVEWADVARQYFPWHSWSYAMLGKYARDDTVRMRAIAIGYYLDKDSERLNSLPKAEIERAVEAYGNLNPFHPDARARTTLDSVI